jgi:hypothetical protein
MSENTRTPRDLETREGEKREEAWKPPSLLPTPNPKDGFKYRWIRASTLGQSDNKNVSARFREGWRPVAAKDHPELQIRSDRNSEFKEGVEVGGLVLCMIPEKEVAKRNAYFGQKSRDQMQSVDNQYLSENDPRMPLLKPERSSRTTFGSGN